MKVLVVGSGGREHALTGKLAESKRVKEIYAAPGNPGTGQAASNVEIDSNDIDGLVKFAKEEEIDLTFVGPEAPLVNGIVQAFNKEGLKIFGPDSEAARLEGSKVFAKKLMKKYGIPTAGYEVFTDPQSAIAYIKKMGAPIVIKAEGLAAGKGAIVAGTEREAVEAVETLMIEKKFGQAGERVVVEEFLEGEEATVLAFTDGQTIIPMIPSQDHKQVFDNDRGPNTGGMGAYAPAPLTETLLDNIYSQILLPTLEGLQKEGIRFKGILYAGLMIDGGKARVLEYNVRFGDPEAQVVLPLLKTDLIEIAEAIIEEDLARVEVEWLGKKAVCVIMASGGYPGNYETGKVITGLAEAENDEGLVIYQAGTELKNSDLVTAGGRVLGVTAVDDSFHDSIERAYKAIEKIDFSGAQYRTDIGQKALKNQRSV